MQSKAIQLLMLFLTSSCRIPDDADSNAKNTKFLQLNVDTRVNPCDNFGNYACGKYEHCIESEHIPLEENVNWTKARFEEIDQKLADLLNGGEPTSNVINKARVLFRSCMEKKNDFGTINAELKRIGFEDPVKIPFSSKLDPNLNLMKTFGRLLKFSTMFNNFFMMGIDVIEDPQNDGKYVPLIITDPLYSPMISENWANNVTQYMYRTLGIEIQNIDDMAKEIENVSTFIRSIQKISKEAKTSPMVKWSRRNLNHLQLFQPSGCPEGKNSQWSFVWEELFKELFGDLWDSSKVASTDFVVYVTNYKALTQIIEILQCTDRATIVRALWLTAIQFVSPISTFKLQSIYADEVNEPLGVYKLKREKQCLAVIKDVFRHVVAHVLVKNLTDEDKTELIDIQKLVKEEFSLLVRETWFSNTAKEYLVPKIDKMKITIPYISTARDASKLIDDYENIQINKRNFYDAYATLLTKNRDELFKRIFSEGEIPNLAYQPPVPPIPYQKTSIAYYPLLNKIEIPLVMTGLPYYYGHKFRALSLGGFGFELARQIAHALDPANISRNEKGFVEFQNWQKADRFDSKSDNTKYAELIKPIKTFLKEENFDSENNKEEMVIDSVGLTVGFRILKRIYPNLDQTNTERKSNPNIIKMHTEDELFTLGVAMTMCQIRNPKSSNKGKCYLDHPDRLNNICKSSLDFVKTWNCDDSTTKHYAMNAAEKYTIFF